MSDRQDVRALLMGAYRQLESMEQRLRDSDKRRDEAIAILGMGCRFPGADDPHELWRLLVNGVDAITEVPASRWDIDAVYHPDSQNPGTMVCRSGGFLRQVEAFDAAFFGISPREARLLDPQQRLVLEVAWEALEHAHLVPSSLYGSKTGVFLGICRSDYPATAVASREEIDAYLGTGSALSAAAGRISYTFGLVGPSISVDTACSSSLVAIHQACESLRRGDCDLALAGGVNLLISPEPSIAFSRAGMLSPRGRCSTFDNAADGYVRGEGCGLVVLRRLSDVEAGGERARALVRGSAINQDGPSGGLTVPNGPAQEAVIRQALKRAGVTPSEVNYVEAHGTGTALGDPIEIGALGEVFSQRQDPLLVGSIKTNIGHLEAAAGIAGLIKIVQSLEHEHLPPHLHFEEPNQHIDWQSLAIEVLRDGIPWPRREIPRRAGVSSFGFSGTNAHVVLEESPTPPKTTASDTTTPDTPTEPPSVMATSRRDAPRLLTLNAQSPASLRHLAERYRQLLAHATPPPWPELCAAAATTREHFHHRLALVATDSASAAETLADPERRMHRSEDSADEAADGEPPRIAWLFSGQGAQYAGMGHSLYRTYPVFRAVLDNAAETLEPHLERPLLEVMFTTSEATEPSLIDRTAYAQPCGVALQLALAALWRSWGVEPVAVLGHSVGEIAAAAVAGIMSPEEALVLAARRGALMEALPGEGAMLAVAVGHDELSQAPLSHQLATFPKVSVAAVNGRRQTVLSGPAEEIESLHRQLETAGLRCDRLVVSHAFHSALMDPLLPQLSPICDALNLAPPQIPFCAAGEDFDPTDAAAWARHPRRTVRFDLGLAALTHHRPTVLLELGPEAVLLALTRRHPGLAKTRAWLPSQRRRSDGCRQILDALGTLYCQGLDLDHAAIHDPSEEATGESRRPPRFALPTYAFDRRRYWLETPAQTLSSNNRSTATADSEAGDSPDHALLGRQTLSARKTQLWQHPHGDEKPYRLADHRIYQIKVAPGSAHLALALVAARETFGEVALCVEQVEFPSPMVVAEGSRRQVQYILEPEADGFQIDGFSYDPDDADPRETSGDPQDLWAHHMRARLSPAPSTLTEPALANNTPTHSDSGGSGQANGSVVERQRWIDRAEHHLEGKTLYRTLDQIGLQLGPSFQYIEALWLAPGETLARLRPVTDTSGFLLPPGLIDSCFQATGSVVLGTLKDPRQAPLYVPWTLNRCTVFGAAHGTLWCHVQATDGAGDGVRQTLDVDLLLSDDNGRSVAHFEGLRLRHAPREALLQTLYQRIDRQLFTVAWKASEHPPALQSMTSSNTMSSNTTSSGATSGPWLLLIGDDPLGPELAKALNQRPEGCRTIQCQTFRHGPWLHRRQHPLSPMILPLASTACKTSNPPTVQASKSSPGAWPKALPSPESSTSGDSIPSPIR